MAMLSSIHSIGSLVRLSMSQARCGFNLESIQLCFIGDATCNKRGANRYLWGSTARVGECHYSGASHPTAKPNLNVGGLAIKYISTREPIDSETITFLTDESGR